MRFFYSVNKLDIELSVGRCSDCSEMERQWNHLKYQDRNKTIRAEPLWPPGGSCVLISWSYASTFFWRCAFMSLYKWDNWDSFREVKRLYITWWENDKASMNPKWSSRVNTTLFRDRSLGSWVCLRGWLMLVWFSLFFEMLVHLSKKSI